MNKKIFVFTLIVMFGFSLALAHDGVDDGDCVEALKYDSVQSLLDGLGEANIALTDCPITLPEKAASILGEGDFQVVINKDEGNASEFYVSIQESQIKGVYPGEGVDLKYTLTTSESTLQEILTSENQPETFIQAYKNGDITLKGNTFTNKIKLFFVKIFSKFI